MTVKQTVIAAAFLVISTPVYANENIFDRAFSYLNLHERSNRTQIQKVTKVDPVRTPWCAAFVNGILKEIGLSGTNSNMAISFNKYKTPTKTPKKGDIVVFAHHVGFFQKFSGNKVAVLGGNQSNKVKVSYFSKSSVLSYRKV